MFVVNDILDALDISHKTRLIKNIQNEYKNANMFLAGSKKLKIDNKKMNCFSEFLVYELIFRSNSIKST